METNLTAYEMALQTDRTRLSAQAGRGWLADQAAAARPHRSLTLSMRRWVGTTLILAGERVQGTAGPVLDAMRADHHPSAIQDA